MHTLKFTEKAPPRDELIVGVLSFRRNGEPAFELAVFYIESETGDLKTVDGDDIGWKYEPGHVRRWAEIPESLFD